MSAVLQKAPAAVVQKRASAVAQNATGTVPQKAARGNRLLERVSRLEGGAMLAACERVHLDTGQVLAKAGEELTHAYFPVDGYVSLIAVVPQGEVEVGLVGKQGVVGFMLGHGAVRSDMKLLVQGAGEALRMDARTFARFVSRSAALRSELSRYAQFMMAEYARAAACNRYHHVEARLARWLLAVSECAHAPEFATTHGAMAAMLGVRRSGVTVAAGSLQNRGLIRYSRGHIEILDRARLERACCGCHKASRHVYETLFPNGSDE